MPKISCQLSVLEEMQGCTRTSSSIGGLVDSNEAMTEFKHVVSKPKMIRGFVRHLNIGPTNRREMIMN